MGRFFFRLVPCCPPTSAAKHLGSHFLEASFHESKKVAICPERPLLESGTVRGYEFDEGM